MATWGIPDWVDASNYAHLLHADRAAFAWEWLRRLPTYRKAAALSISSGARHDYEEWGLHRFEDPALPVPLARPFWTRQRYVSVLLARRLQDPSPGDGFDLTQLGDLVSRLNQAGTMRLLLSDGLRSIRLDVESTPANLRRFDLEFRLPGIRRLERPLQVLQSLRTLILSGAFPFSSKRSRRNAKLIQMLRAHDAQAAGASHADIALLILDPRMNRAGWREHSPFLRSRAQRLAAAARLMADRGFWSLLH